MKKFITILAIIGFATQVTLAQAPTLQNSPATNAQVQTFVEIAGNRIIKIAGDQALSDTQRRKKIMTVVDDVIDPNWIAKFVLGRNFKALNDQQKERFFSLYRSFMVGTYGPKFNSYNGRKFEVKSVVEHNKIYVAKAVFIPKEGAPINIDFRVISKDGKLAVVDFVAEGISLLETQRSEFTSAISTQGVEGFLSQLEAKVKALK